MNNWEFEISAEAVRKSEGLETACQLGSSDSDGDGKEGCGTEPKHQSDGEDEYFNIFQLLKGEKTPMEKILT